MPNVDIFTLILVDTGNTTPNDIISEEFFKVAGLTLIPQDKKMRLGTADGAGGGLQVLGQVAQLKLHVEGISKPIVLQPWVVRGLSHPVNISMKFMQENNVILQTNPQGGNRFIINGDSTRTVRAGEMFPEQKIDSKFPKDSGQYYQAAPLVWERHGRGKRQQGRTRTVEAVSDRKREESIGQIYRRQTNQLYIREPVTIPAGSMKFISTQATERLEGEVFVEDLGEKSTRDLEQGLLVPRAVYSAINNIYFIAISNFGSENIKLRPGTRVAAVYRAEEFNVCVVTPAKSEEEVLNPTNQVEAATLNQSARGRITADSKYVPHHRSQRTSRATLKPKRERAEKLQLRPRCKDSEPPDPPNRSDGATLSGKTQVNRARPGLPATTAGARNGPPGPGRIQNLTDGTNWTEKEKEKFIKENLPFSKMKLIQHRPDIQTQLVEMLVENFSCLSLHENDSVRRDRHPGVRN